MNGNGSKPEQVMKNFRCPDCGRFWFTAHLVPGCILHVRCYRCGRDQVVKQTPEGLLIGNQQTIMAIVS